MTKTLDELKQEAKDRQEVQLKKRSHNRKMAAQLLNVDQAIVEQCSLLADLDATGKLNSLRTKTSKLQPMSNLQNFYYSQHKLS